MGKRHGFALVLTLWILAALVILVGALALAVHTEMALAGNFGDLSLCRWAARAGMNRGLSEVERLVKSPTTYLGATPYTIDSEAEGIDLGQTTFEVAIEDEAGKVNINTAPRDMLVTLFNSEEIADAIIDWRDKDDTPGAQGAEDAYYISLPSPYHCKNAPFDTVRELLLVKGVTREVLAQQMTDDGLKLEDLLTIESTDANTRVDGTARVNIKTASQSQLKTALSDVLTDNDITAIISYRTGTPAGAGGGRPSTPSGPATPTPATSSAASTRFQTAGEIASVPNLTREKAEKIYDRLTVSTEKSLPGLININTAPIPVLAAVSGMDDTMAKAIVDYREANGAFADVGQLLAVDDISTSVFAKVADLFTVRSKHFKLVSTGRMANGVLRAVTCIVDATSGTAQVKYWRE